MTRRVGWRAKDQLSLALLTEAGLMNRELPVQEAHSASEHEWYRARESVSWTTVFLKGYVFVSPWSMDERLTRLRTYDMGRFELDPEMNDMIQTMSSAAVILHDRTFWWTGRSCARAVAGLNHLPTGMLMVLKAFHCWRLQDLSTRTQ